MADNTARMPGGSPPEARRHPHCRAQVPEWVIAAATLCRRGRTCAAPTDLPGCVGAGRMTRPPDEPLSGEIPDPDQIHTVEEFSAGLAALKGHRSYSAITTAAEELTPSRARETSGAQAWTPEALSRGTVSDWLGRRGLPTRNKLLTFLVVCDVDAVQIPSWTAALERIKNRAADVTPRTHDTATGADQAASASVPPDSSRRRLFAGLGVVVVVAVLVVVLAARGIAGGGETGPTATLTPSSAAAAPPSVTTAPAVCAVVANGTTLVQPQPSTEGAQSGLTFCPVRINGGHLPITGPFALQGQVLGPLALRHQVLLVNYGDPQTCDALGNRPPTGGFLIHNAEIGSPDGNWSYTDQLGYAEAVTIARHYEYLTASPQSLTIITNDRQNWEAAHPGKSGDYPGILSLPADSTVLATFDVPAGVYKGARPCPSP